MSRFQVKKVAVLGAGVMGAQIAAHLANAEVPVAELVGDPVAELAALQPRRNPAIPLPADIFPGRRNSAGVDLADPMVRDPLLAALKDWREDDEPWTADPTVELPGGAAPRPVTAPHDRAQLIGLCRDATAAEVDEMIARAVGFQQGWDALGGAERAGRLEEVADLYEAHTQQFLSLCQREAGKTLSDAVLELREAVDFCRYYAARARADFAAPLALPGPTGERNQLLRAMLQSPEFKSLP